MPTYKHLEVKERNVDVRVACHVAEAEIPTEVAAGEVLVKVSAVGINATDMNSFLGAYGGVPPFTAGLEAMGTVEIAGEGAKIGGQIPAQKGMHVLIGGLGCFAEYKTVEAFKCIPIPALEPKYLTFGISVLTSAIAVEELAEAKEGETAIVTAAAGGAGQFAVQVLKQKKCHVIGTCSSEEKVEFLKSIGCDRVINYKKEVIADVLKKEYPKGVDIVYESVGGDTFEACLDNLATFGRIIVIGSITGYKSQTAFQRAEGTKPLQLALLSKSASVKGFMLPAFAPKFGKYIPQYLPQVISGELKCQVDEKSLSFVGVEQIPDGVEHLHSGKSFGKVIVQLHK